MSIHAMSWAIKVKGLPIATKAVLMMLAECHNGETGQCNPSIRYLREITGLKERALQLHFKALEASGLIARDYAYHGRGKGCSVEQYNLKIGILGTVKKDDIDAKDIAPAKECARKIRSMRPQNIALPLKEEPEENRNTPIPPTEQPEPSAALARSVVDQILQIIPKAKASMAPDSLPKVVRTILRKTPPEQLLAAVRACYSTERHTREEGQYAPAIYTFLNKGVWKNWAGDQASAPAEMTTEGWQRAMRHWVDTGEWLADYASPPPSDRGCTAPANMIRHALKLRPERSAA